MSALAAGCAPAVASRPLVKAPRPSPETVVTAAPDAACRAIVRRVSTTGTGAARPQVAAGDDAFAVAWEETTDHRGVRVQTFDLEARPLGPSIEVADVTRSGADPRVIADGEGFLVLWTVEEGDSSVIYVRRLDRAGKSAGDTVPLVTSPGARALSAVSFGSDYAVAWWNWSGLPHVVTVRYFDHRDQPLGKPFVVSRAPSPDPTVDLAPMADGHATIAWEEMLGGDQHVWTALLTHNTLDGRRDLGAGETPEFAGDRLVWERPADAGLYVAPIAGGTALRLTDGHTPAAATRSDGRAALCFVRDTSLEQGRADELWCARLTDGKLVQMSKLALAPRGILTLQAAASKSRLAAAWQAQEDDDTSVSVATISCRGDAGSSPARP
ncbi:MAG TPA: hypothetical protein VIA18_14845 [Polyangia bacterium]|nr:hypothetical protein [Polyangia bacterium]